MNLKNLVPGILTLGAILGATAAQAQITSGSLTTPNAPAFGSGVTVVGSAIGVLQSVPLAFPTLGNSIILQFTAVGDLFQFNNLPATGTGASGPLTSIVNLVANPGGVAIPINLTTSYSYDADATIPGPPSQSGTLVSFFHPSGGSSFFFNGSNYTLDLNTVQIFGAGAPTTLSTNTITGTLTNTGASAPEPGTLALAALGIVGMVVRRKYSA